MDAAQDPQETPPPPVTDRIRLNGIAPPSQPKPGVDAKATVGYPMRTIPPSIASLRVMHCADALPVASSMGEEFSVIALHFQVRCPVQG
jgi:hypothetical protein